VCTSSDSVPFLICTSLSTYPISFLHQICPQICLPAIDAPALCVWSPIVRHVTVPLSDECFMSVLRHCDALSSRFSIYFPLIPSTVSHLSSSRRVRSEATGRIANNVECGVSRLFLTSPLTATQPQPPLGCVLQRLDVCKEFK
jgi:hypothetical protein